MTVRVIKNETQYEAACQRIYEMINASQDPIVPGSSEADEMELLSILVEKYERELLLGSAPSHTFQPVWTEVPYWLKSMRGSTSQ